MCDKDVPYGDERSLDVTSDTPLLDAPVNRCLRERSSLVCSGKTIVCVLTAVSAWSLWNCMDNKLFLIESHFRRASQNSIPTPLVEAARAQCRLKDARAGPPPMFDTRKENDRVLPGTSATVVRNATVWTGDEVLHEIDVILDHGLIVDMRSADRTYSYDNAQVLDAAGRWLTPGIVDMHSHLGVGPMPAMQASMDENSKQGPVRPMLRSIDSFNEHDHNLRSVLSGGITTTLVLPGSLDNIGGEAFPIKLGRLAGRAPSERVIDVPRSFTMAGESNHRRDEMYRSASGMARPDGSTAFRHVKMACGENARRAYNLVRMDEAWNFRSSFERAQKLRDQQDDFCIRLDSQQLTINDARFPVDRELDLLVDVLRGRTKVQTHCYTMNDLDAFVRHANEFGFSIAAFHHAHEAYLAARVLHKAPGGAPAVALFSRNANYKFESYYGTPFQAALLQAQNITPVFKSDHPVLDSRRLVTQAAQGHHFGLGEWEALRAVTSAPARVLGLDHRLGFVRRGMDADIVLWDRHPLRLGATPVQVFVDGAAQLETHLSGGSSSGDDLAPPSGRFDDEIRRVRASFDDISAGHVHAFPTPLGLRHTLTLTNVSRVFMRESVDGGGTHIVEHMWPLGGTLVYEDGHITCLGPRCPVDSGAVNLHGGFILPGLTSYGSTLGLADIASEASTSAGTDANGLRHGRFDAQRLVPRAADELIWGGHDLMQAHASGVTHAVVAPQVDGLFGGVSALFATQADSVLDRDSVPKREVAMHVQFAHYGSEGPSLAMQIALLRDQLLRPSTPEWERVVRGDLPLVVKADGQSTVAQLLALKREQPALRMVLDSAGALHKLAAELAALHVGIVMPSRSWLYEWDGLDRLAGPPLEAETELAVLRKHGVSVALRIQEPWEAGNLLWEATMAAQEARLSTIELLELLTTQLETMLGLPAVQDWVAFDRNPFEYGARAVAVGSPHGVDTYIDI